MVKILNFFSLSDDKCVKKGEKLYMFPYMNTAGFYSAYGGPSFFPYLFMIKYRDF